MHNPKNPFQEQQNEFIALDCILILYQYLMIRFLTSNQPYFESDVVFGIGISHTYHMILF